MSFIKDVPNKKKKECFLLHAWYIISVEGGVEYKICSNCGHGKISLFTDVPVYFDESTITDLQKDNQYEDLLGSELI